MILRDSESYSTQIIIGLLLNGGVLIMIGMLSPSSETTQDPMGKDGVSYSYQMPRIEGEEMPFDLSGREVSRDLREIEALEKKKAAVKAEEKKKEDKAKAAVEAQKKAAAAQRAAYMRARAAMAARVVSASDRFRMKSGLSANQSGTNPRQQDSSTYGAPYAQAAETNSADEKDDDDDLNLSPAQWRSLLQVQPTAANIALLMKARAAGKVNDSVIAEIVRDLLKDSAEDRRKAGLRILNQAPSSVLFAFMVKNKAEFAADVQTSIQTVIDSYSTPAKLIYLGPLLASSTDKTVLETALKALNVAVGNYKNTQSGQSTSGTVSAPTIGQLQIFLGTLKIVGTNADSSVANLAQTLSQDIQSLRTSALSASGRNQVAYAQE